MSKITRATMKLFGSTGIAGSPSLFKKFGGFASSDTANAGTPALIQSLAAYLSGWQAAITGGNSPTLEDMNSLCYLFSYQLGYILQEGVSEWDSGTTYYIGSIVNSAGTLYYSLSDTNLNNAVTDKTNWTQVGGKSLNPQANATLAARAVTTWTGKVAASASQWNDMCWSVEQTLFVAVAGDGLGGGNVMTSPDGTTWTTRTPSETNLWSGVCYSPELNLYIAVSQDGTNRVMSSPDGSTWTARTAAEANTWNAVTWSPELGIFVAVASSGTHRVMTSTNGTAWTARTAASAHLYTTVCWSPELALFVAAGNNGSTAASIMTSPDGVTWTSRTVPASVGEIVKDSVWSSDLGIFVIISYDADGSGDSYNVMTSRDGITWVGRVAAYAAPTVFLSIAWSPALGVFVAVGTGDVGTNNIMYSRDGITWTGTSSGTSQVLGAVTYAPKLGIFASAAQNQTTNGVRVSKYVQKFICP